MKSSITADFLLFFAGLIILVVVMATAFGRGVIMNFMNYFTKISPEFLAEDISTFLTVAAYTPGDFSASIKIENKRDFSIINFGDNYNISVSNRTTSISRPIAYDPNLVSIEASSTTADPQTPLLIRKIEDILKIGEST